MPTSSGTPQPDVEHVHAGATLLAIVVRARFAPERTTFVTTDDHTQQFGYVVYPAGGEVARHYHQPVERRVTGTSEVIVVRSGRCLLDIYDQEQRLVKTCELGPGDVSVMISGGHGYRMLEDTVLLEVKQGPYTGLDEKRRF